MIEHGTELAHAWSQPVYIAKVDMEISFRQDFSRSRCKLVESTECLSAAT